MKIALESILDQNIPGKGRYTGELCMQTRLPHVQGCMIYTTQNQDTANNKNLISYDGEWYQGMWHGYGALRFVSGDIYMGEFVEGFRHGSGRYAYSDGRVYEGDFCQNIRTGKGVFQWPDKSLYKGYFQNGKRHGLGYYKFGTTGDMYSGNWKDGQYEGFGLFTWANGTTYKGQWKNSMRHGHGIEKDKNGKVLHHGMWENHHKVTGIDASSIMRADSSTTESAKTATGSANQSVVAVPSSSYENRLLPSLSRQEESHSTAKDDADFHPAEPSTTVTTSKLEATSATVERSNNIEQRDRSNRTWSNHQVSSSSANYASNRSMEHPSFQRGKHGIWSNSKAPFSPASRFKDEDDGRRVAGKGDAREDIVLPPLCRGNRPSIQEYPMDQLFKASAETQRMSPSELFPFISDDSTREGTIFDDRTSCS